MGRAGLLDWWLLQRKDHNELKQRGIDSVVMLVLWALRKEHNVQVFGRSLARIPSEIFNAIWMDDELWVLAGAKWMVALGWPYSTFQVAGSPQ